MSDEDLLCNDNDPSLDSEDDNESDDGDYDLLDDDFSNMVLRPRIYEVEFTVHSPQDIIKKQEVEKINPRNFLKCPAPGCEYIIECEVPEISLTTIAPIVECKCSNRFCFRCTLPDHQPTTCMLVQKWAEKCENDSETNNWISAFTKKCGSCNSYIEKNGGGNPITCTKCNNRFCWTCMKPLRNNTYEHNCNLFDENFKDAENQRAKSRASLGKYLNYYHKYSYHEKFLELKHELYSKTEVQFLTNAVNALVKCHMTLKWTYIFAFYLDRNNETEIFEINQSDIENAAEMLYELLKKSIITDELDGIKEAIIRKTEYVENRRKIILEDTAKGLLENRWRFQI
ncbi:9927_t:CDS:2 [Cetraspora pellucida]|uniref:9927_t:CDS:1 n=1 Tax=Cetraspora pellucida TaxID=1433469 RepID=A0ACA9JZK0_9GLOM|nr:9927_t:CDS:2 [Cetraspora pellucida]